MYTYEYETVSVRFDGWGPFSGNDYSLMADYREIINSRSKNGWRYVGYLPTRQRGTGHVQELDMIFEKEV